MNKFIKPISQYLQNNYVCNKNFKDTYTNVSNIYVIGDIHGDLSVLIRSLRKINIIDAGLNWKGGNSHIVQLGDLLDGGGRGSNMNTNNSSAMEEFTIFEFLNNLDNQARKKGGRVHYLIGNHELMNLLGDFRYVATNHLNSTGIETRKKLFKPGGYMASMLACHSYGVLKINNWIFCHAGLLPQHINNRSITDINNLVRGVFSGKIGLQNISAEEQELLLGNTSLFWNRFYAKNSNNCTVLNKTLDIVNKGSGGMIVGHTPHYNITNVCRQKLYFADVGLSRAFTQHNFKNIQILHIRNGEQPRVI